MKAAFDTYRQKGYTSMMWQLSPDKDTTLDQLESFYSKNGAQIMEIPGPLCYEIDL